MVSCYNLLVYCWVCRQKVRWPHAVIYWHSRLQVVARKPAGEHSKCYKTVTGRPICITGHAVTQAVSRRPHTAKTKVSIPGQSVWDLYWIFWHWDKFFSQFSGLSPIFIIQLVLHFHNLTLRLLMSYIYGAPIKVRNANVVYIWTYVWQRWNSLFLFAAQCFNTESMQRVFLCHICV